MGLSFWQEIYVAFHYAFRSLIPLPHHRTPWSWSNVYLHLIPYPPIFFMAYLARRRDTFAIRLLLLPVTILFAIIPAYGFYWPQPWLQASNWTQALGCAQIIAKALDLALTPTGRLKVGETKLPPIGGEKDTHAPSSPTTKHRASKPSFFPPAVNDAFELLCTFRGYGWDFGQGVYVPQEYRPLERGPFLKATLKIFLKYFILLDLLDSCLKLIPGVGSPLGGSMFFPLPPIQRYAISTTIHIMTGTVVLSGFETAYAFSTLIGVGLLNQSPLLWPPFFDLPFSSDSLAIFWAKRWHQLLRRTFFVFGGYPGEWLGSLISKEAGKLGMLFGVFIASGLFHELTTYTMGRGFDRNITMFFVVQAAATLSERVWYKVTGRKVQGWIGLFWVYFCIMILGQPCVDAWHHRGLGGSIIVPPPFSPVRYILWPILRRVHPIFENLP